MNRALAWLLLASLPCSCAPRWTELGEPERTELCAAVTSALSEPHLQGAFESARAAVSLEPRGDVPRGFVVHATLELRADGLVDSVDDVQPELPTGVPDAAVDVVEAAYEATLALVRVPAPSREIRVPLTIRFAPDAPSDCHLAADRCVVCITKAAAESDSH